MLADAAEPTPDIPYARRAARMDREYEAAFATLTPAKREALRKLGITGPELNDPESRQGTRDVSEFVEISSPPPPPDPRRHTADDLAELLGLAPAQVPLLLAYVERRIEAEAERRLSLKLARVAGQLVREKNVKVSVMGLAFAAEIDDLNLAGFPTMRAAAKALRCSPAYISSFANMWCDELDLPRPPGMKSAASRPNYSQAQKNGHWRHQKCPKTPPKTP